MLRMQIDVKNATEGIDKTVQSLGGKAQTAEIQKSQKEVLILEAEAEKDRKKRDEEIKRINELQGSELNADFDRVMREMNAGGRS